MSNFSAASESSPVADKDEAETFNEPEVNLSLDSATVQSGSVELGTAVNGTEATLENWTYDTDRSNLYGATISPNVQGVYGFEVRMAPNTDGVDTIELRESDGTVITSKSVPNLSTGDTARIEADSELPAGTDVDVVAGSTSTYGAGGTDGDPSVSTADFDVVAPNSSSNYRVIDQYRAVKDALSGAVTVGWPIPTDIYAWDVGVYQYRDDGGSVDVFIEAEQSGSWTEIAGPISRGNSIDADPADNVRYRVELSRTDPSQNPTLDAIYRRFKL